MLQIPAANKKKHISWVIAYHMHIHTQNMNNEQEEIFWFKKAAGNDTPEIYACERVWKRLKHFVFLLRTIWIVHIYGMQ